MSNSGNRFFRSSTVERHSKAIGLQTVFWLPKKPSSFTALSSTALSRRCVQPANWNEVLAPCRIVHELAVVEAVLHRIPPGALVSGAGRCTKTAYYRQYTPPLRASLRTQELTLIYHNGGSWGGNRTSFCSRKKGVLPARISYGQGVDLILEPHNIIVILNLRSIARLW